ncbi:hypothetical protein F0562_024563 [Nyssa sinensis]|uniref:Uncharacterized protein n=1 Tax=Nyssa sinensis TaxID=561372 RepID=A0A5J5BCZ6_9ASTE|nr:hypothetical protein F0562_024563 [Nyssa sinensis]
MVDVGSKSATNGCIGRITLEAYTRNRYPFNPFFLSKLKEDKIFNSNSFVELQEQDGNFGSKNPKSSQKDTSLKLLPFDDEQGYANPRNVVDLDVDELDDDIDIDNLPFIVGDRKYWFWDLWGRL